MRRRHAPFVAFVFLFAHAVAAQADPADDRIRVEMKRQNIPGLSLAVVKNGAIVKSAGYGFAHIKFKTPATLTGTRRSRGSSESALRAFWDSALSRLVGDTLPAALVRRYRGLHMLIAALL